MAADCSSRNCKDERASPLIVSISGSIEIALPLMADAFMGKRSFSRRFAFTARVCFCRLWSLLEPDCLDYMSGMCEHCQVLANDM